MLINIANIARAVAQNKLLVSVGVAVIGMSIYAYHKDNVTVTSTPLDASAEPKAADPAPVDAEVVSEAQPDPVVAEVAQAVEEVAQAASA